MKSYEKEQQRVQSTFFKKRGLNLSGDNLYPYILSNSNVKWNFFNESLYRRAVAYFRENQITWWKGKRPTTNTLSSQVSCINHLMPLMDNKGAVLNLLKSIDSSFDDVLPLYENKPKEFIGFEVVSDIDHLGEIKSSKPHRLMSQQRSTPNRLLSSSNLMYSGTISNTHLLRFMPVSAITIGS